MGMPGPWELIIILAIVAILFGTGKLRNIGSDLGTAVKGFQNAFKGGGDSEEKKVTKEDKPSSNVIEGEVDNHSDDKRA